MLSFSFKPLSSSRQKRARQSHRIYHLLLVLCTALYFVPSNSLLALSIALSNTPYIEITSTLAGPEASVFTIVPENASPHTFEPSPLQLEQLLKADVWFGIGEPFEEKIKGMLHNKGPRFIDLRNGVSLIQGTKGCTCHHPGHAHTADPHIWMDPNRMKIQVRTIAQALSPFVNNELLEGRVRALLQELDVLDGQIRELLVKYRGIILVSHPVYAYLIDGLPIEQVALEQEGKELSPKAFSNVIEQAKKQRVSTVFTQPQYSKKSAEKVADYIQAKIVSLNPYSREYFKELLKIAKAFHDELERQQRI